MTIAEVRIEFREEFVIARSTDLESPNLDVSARPDPAIDIRNRGATILARVANHASLPSVRVERGRSLFQVSDIIS